METEVLIQMTVTKSSPAGMLFVNDYKTQERRLTIYRHAWMSYMVDKAPTEDPLLQRQVRIWEPKEHKPVPTFTRGAYKPFNT